MCHVILVHAPFMDDLTSAGWDLLPLTYRPNLKFITTPVPHHSVFYRPDALPAAHPNQTSELENPHIPVIDPSEVDLRLANIKIHKAPGPDGIPNWLLRDFSGVFSSYMESSRGHPDTQSSPSHFHSKQSETDFSVAYSSQSL